MNINNEKITTLVSDVYNNRRRRVSSIPKEMKYIDKEGNLMLLNSDNFNIIIGRRGTGKSALISKNIIDLKSNSHVVIDCQKYHLNTKKNDKDILIDCLLEFLVILDNEISSIKEKKDCKFLFIKIQKTDRKIKLQKKYCSKALYEIKETLLFASEMDDDYLKTTRKVTVSNNNEHSTSKKKSDILRHRTQGTITLKGSGKAQISGAFKDLADGCAKVNININSLSFGSIKTDTCILDEQDNSSNFSEKTEFYNQKKVSKTDLLMTTKDNIITLLNLVKQICDSKFRVYLDEFSQIEMNYHPLIIHYFHDIHKLTSNFYPKIVIVPGALKLNDETYKGFNLTDDFSVVSLGYDLSELDLNINYLLEILIASLTSKVNITSDEIKELFDSQNTLNLTVIASGCIPRDFMDIFVYSIQISKTLHKEKIDSEVLYEVINKIKKDKEAEISKDNITVPIIQITKARNEIINFVSVYNTNVFLYPIDKTQDKNHFDLLENLVNLSYLHLLCEKVRIPNGDEFKCYLIDMTFYANVPLPLDFTFVQIWNKKVFDTFYNLQQFTFSDTTFINETAGQIDIQPIEIVVENNK